LLSDCFSTDITSLTGFFYNIRHIIHRQLKSRQGRHIGRKPSGTIYQ
jgi:hypothetical protein